MPNMLIQQSPSFLSQGNAALREKNYVAAMSCYLQAAKHKPVLGKIIAANIRLTQQKYQQQSASEYSQKIFVCGCDFGKNDADRLRTLATLHQPFAEVAIIVSIFPQLGHGLKPEQLQCASLSVLSLVVSDSTQFLAQALEFVLAHPCHVIHLSNPHAPNILLGFLYKLVWDARVVVDINDEELASIAAEKPLNIQEYIKHHADLPNIALLNGDEWTRLAIGLINEFDGVTVSNPALKKRFGGETLNEEANQQSPLLGPNAWSAISSWLPELAQSLTEAFNALHVLTLLPIPKTLSNIRLNPANQLELDVDNVKYWRSLGNDPHFHVEGDSGKNLAAGWYRVDLLIEASHTRNLAKFYVDYGEGISEANAFILPYASMSLATRVVCLRNKVHSIRFDPKEKNGRFRVFSLHFTPITENEANDLMLRQIASVKVDATQTETDFRRKFEKLACKKQTTLAEQICPEYDEFFVALPGSSSYQEWIETVEIADLPTVKQVATTLGNLVTTPLISVIMPTYNTDEECLRACIDSVLAQTYPHWELCIADDASVKPHVRNILESYAAQDARIRVVFRPKNGHISRASNSALEIAQGDFIALLDHDDALPVYALYFIAIEINENPQAQIFYSDEDKLDARGERFDPHFKGEWNPDLFYSQNYVSHLGVYRRELLNRINGFRPGVEGSQDQDLLLRCLAHVKNDQIIHIPRVLYHWRMVEGSTALASGEKSYTTDAGIRALRDYFAELHPAVQVDVGQVANTYRVRWPVPDPAPLVSLLIPTRDRRALTETCVRSILDRSTYTNFEILILDNGSVEAETLEFFAQIQKEDRRVRVLRYDHPFNYSAINNFGVREARGEVIGLVNNDIEVISPEWLTEMVSHALRPDIGCVGAKLYYSNDTIQHAGVICSLGGVAGHSHKHFPREHPGYFHRLLLTQTLSAVTAACLLVRRSIYEQVGGLDEKNLHVAFNDVDFCLMVREAGYRNLWTPYAELYHYESISRGAEDTPEKIERFRKEVEFMQNKWGDALKIDPYYSPNLTRDREDFSLGA